MPKGAICELTNDLFGGICVLGSGPFFAKLVKFSAVTTEEMNSSALKKAGD